MGSSKTGSLDKFAAFSPAAALASGKVKLPETGIVGMLQAKQEDKMNKGAQMAQQDDNSIASYLDFYKQQMNSGMNMGGRVGFSEGSGPDMDRVLELEEQGFSYEEAFEKAMQERLDRGFNQGGRVGFSEGSGPDMDRVLELEEQGFSYEEAFEKAMQERLDRGFNQGGRVEMGFGGLLGKALKQFINAKYAKAKPGSRAADKSVEAGMGKVGPNADRDILKEQADILEQMKEMSEFGYAAGGPVESMKFLKQHLPYQDGGHVALRRKMFKMGGPVNTHGIGITSGLEFRNNYNAGGSVRQNFSKAGMVKKLIELAKKNTWSKSNR